MLDVVILELTALENVDFESTTVKKVIMGSYEFRKSD